MPGKGFYFIQAMCDDGSAFVQFVDDRTNVGSPPFRVTKKKLEKLRELADVREG